MKPCEGFKISGSQHAWNVKPFWCYNMRYANLHSPSMESVWPCRAASNKWSEVFSNYNGKNKISNWTAEKSAALILLWSDGYPILRGFRSVAKEEASNTFPLSSDKKYSNPPHPLSLESPPPHNVDKPNVRRWLTDASIRTLSFIFARPNLVIPSTSP